MSQVDKKKRKTIWRTGKERTRISFSKAKEAKTQRRQEDVRIFPRCQVIDAGKEEDFKSDVLLQHVTFEQENLPCLLPPHMANP